MSPELLRYAVCLLVAHGALVVLLTRMRLGGAAGAGRLDVGTGLLTCHTTTGTVAVVCWATILLSEAAAEPTGGPLTFVALAAWWAVASLGVLILLRWLPARGRHASPATADAWSSGPLLSVVAHGSVLLDAGVLTWLVATGTL
ncbi:hypothetical protein [Nocardioides antri]|uniref:Uncharacterized protein n=1 Tax=Nocardioides antri TaxID=2607659 RepID=A0A5B1MBM2_9ACTN|nr:hypothetical protein [Nocardioides antri]KAA1429327.1 hypothetical protein F0U47_03830 [Nocardioides antri]